MARREKYLIDTNIISFAARSNWSKREDHHHWLSRRLRLSVDKCFLPSIALQELHKGLQSQDMPEKQKRRTNRWIKKFKILPFDSKCAQIAGRIEHQLKQKGTPLETADIQIAATAIANNLTLLTDNTKHFSRISGLKIENWKGKPISRPDYAHDAGLKVATWLWQFASAPFVFMIALSSMFATQPFRLQDWLPTFALSTLLFTIFGAVLLALMTKGAVVCLLAFEHCFRRFVRLG